MMQDAASSEWKSEKGKGFYKLPKAGTGFTSDELIEHWAKLVSGWQTGICGVQRLYGESGRIDG